ncbi:MAG: hypothetical protein J6W35_04265 [Eubacterium sp.]|nr:hypothetical protein [Eubacterium sp.]
MRKIWKRVAVIGLAMALVVGMIPASVNVSAAKSDNTSELAKQVNDGSDPFDFSEHTGNAEKKLKSKMENAPSSYDLRDVDGECYVTPVKFQNPFGTCWGFGAVAAAESSILGSGLAQSDGLDERSLNLSEKHLVNFYNQPIADKNNSQYGEGVYYIDKNLSLTDKFDKGGLNVFASSMFSSGIGPVQEDDARYEYHGANELVQKRKIKGNWVNYCYSENDDWSLPEEERFTQSYSLKQSFTLPSPATKVKDGEDEHYEYNPEGTLAIKDQLLNKRAVSIGFCADSSLPDQDVGDPEYISKHWAHYTYNEEEGADHCVTIVGWDDNYPKENFIEGHEPPEDGAWLVKNSWGSGEEEFPNNGGGDWGIVKDGVHTGYFWLSFYDKTIDMPEALEFDKSNRGNSYIIDEYDFMPVEDVNNVALDDELSTANVFTAEVSQKLEEIAFVTGAPGDKVEYSVYLLPEYADNPTDGLEVASGVSPIYEYGGFHKLKLDNSVVLPEGQQYSIVLSEISADGSYSINLEIGQSEATAEMLENSSYVKGVVNLGESFFKTHGYWYDYGDDTIAEKSLGITPLLTSRDNFPIKAICTPMPNLNVTFNLGTDVELPPLGVNGSETIKVRFEGDKDLLPDNPEISWEAMPGSEKVFEMKPDPDNDAECQVVPIWPGTGYIKVDLGAYGIQAVRVTVTKTGKYYVDDEWLDVGEPAETLVTDKDGNQYETDQYKLRSLNPDIVKIDTDNVTMIGLKPGVATVVVYDDESGAETEFKVTVRPAPPVEKIPQYIKAKGKTVKVKYKALKKKKKTVKRKKYMKLSGTKGKVRYAIKSVKKKKYKKFFKISKKTGKITIKKKLKKGTYKLKIRVKAYGNSTYMGANKTVTVKIKVK